MHFARTRSDSMHVMQFAGSTVAFNSIQMINFADSCDQLVDCSLRSC
jgi:hypothetical protein